MMVYWWTHAAIHFCQEKQHMYLKYDVGNPISQESGVYSVSLNADAYTDQQKTPSEGGITIQLRDGKAIESAFLTGRYKAEARGLWTAA